MRQAALLVVFLLLVACDQRLLAEDSASDLIEGLVPKGTHLRAVGQRDPDSVFGAPFARVSTTSTAGRDGLTTEIVEEPTVFAGPCAEPCCVQAGNGCCSWEPPYNTTYGFPTLAGGARHSTGYGGCGCSAQFGLCDGALGDPFWLSAALYGTYDPTILVGGWLSAGYHSESNGLFNSRPDNFALHQGWLYAEKSANWNTSPWGFRVDVLYGIDANDTQVFGGPAGHFDFQNGLDHGAYGWAIPQAYGELALGQWNVILGHFLTPIGYETVTAPDNFFYSHSMSMYVTQPKTQTGALVTRPIYDGRHMLMGGWTQGWDVGFERSPGTESSYLAGAIFQLNPCAALSYVWTNGTICARGIDGNSHTLVFDKALTNRLNWVTEGNLLRVGSTGEDNAGIVQYLFYTVSDWLRFGTRIEWWKGDVISGYRPHGGVLPAAGSLSYYAWTTGVNIRPHANFIVRPEFRYDWSPAANYDQGYFGIDAIFTF